MSVSDEELSYRFFLFKSLRKFIQASNDIINFEYRSDTPPFKLLITDTGTFYWNYLDIQIHDAVLGFYLYRRLIVDETAETPADYELVPTTKFEAFAISDSTLWLKVNLMSVEQYTLTLLARSKGETEDIVEVPTLIQLPAGSQRQLINITIGKSIGIQRNITVSFVMRLPEKGVYAVKSENHIRSTLREFINTLVDYNRKFNRNWVIHLLK